MRASCYKALMPERVSQTVHGVESRLSVKVKTDASAISFILMAWKMIVLPAGSSLDHEGGAGAAFMKES